MFSTFSPEKRGIYRQNLSTALSAINARLSHTLLFDWYQRRLFYCLWMILSVKTGDQMLWLDRSWRMVASFFFFFFSPTSVLVYMCVCVCVCMQGSTLAVARWPGATRNWCRATKLSKKLQFGGPIGQLKFQGDDVMRITSYGAEYYRHSLPTVKANTRHLF